MASVAGRSRSDVEQLGNEGRLGPHVASANPPDLPLPHHRHHLVACQGSSRRPEAAEAEPQSHQAFYAPMVLFHDVIEILDLTQPRASPQLAMLKPRNTTYCSPPAFVNLIALPMRFSNT